jgi:hypothetical protein
MLHLPRRIADTLARFARRMSIGDLSEYGLPIPDERPIAPLHRLGVAPAIVEIVSRCGAMSHAYYLPLGRSMRGPDWANAPRLTLQLDESASDCRSGRRAARCVTEPHPRRRGPEPFA